jgi:hypothetical protein
MKYIGINYKALPPPTVEGVSAEKIFQRQKEGPREN